ncbi:MAG: hypothetical protein OHK0050_21950 [Roseiflexaceae bacterium]
MQTPTIPNDEAERLAALYHLHILQTPPEERFDRLTRLTTQVFQVPIALISMIDVDQQWFKSCIGLAIRGTERDISFCGHTILQPEIFVVEDALLDPRFADNPLVLGDPYICFYAGYPVHAPNGQPVGTICIIDQQPRTLSAQQAALFGEVAALVERELSLHTLEQARQQQHAAESRQRALLNAIPDLMFLLSRDGVYLDYKAARMSDLLIPPEVFLGRTIEEVMPSDLAWRFRQSLEQALRTNSLQQTEYLLEVGEKAREYEARLIPSGDQEVLVIVRDITERKAVDRMKNEFVSMVSHELRTPLTSIRGALGLIVGGAAGAISSQARTMIDIALKNSERLVRLINDILDIEKIESGKLAFTLRPHNLRSLLEQAISDHHAYATQYGVELALQASEDQIALVDPDRFLQVMANLLSNATKFSPPGACVHVRLLTSSRGVRVEVHDHGPGIPSEFHSQIFQKFAQADASNTRRQGGTGLGLSISKAIIERMHGQIDFRLDADGTIFFFELPYWNASISTPITNNKRVLVCEDDPDMANLLAATLAAEGWGIDIALNGTQARQLLREHHYAAMTLDLLLPDEDGYELLRTIRTTPHTRDLPVIIVSSQIESGNSAPIQATQWVSKPVDPQLLRSTIWRLIYPSHQNPARILHVEDDSDIVAIIRGILGQMADVIHAADLQAAQQLLHTEQFDLILLDMHLPDGYGAHLLPVIQHIPQPPPVVVFSADEIQATTEQIAATLIKSRTSNKTILHTIARLLQQPLPYETDLPLHAGDA